MLELKMSDRQAAELARLAGEATPGEWSYHGPPWEDDEDADVDVGDDVTSGQVHHYDNSGGILVSENMNANDAAFIAAANPATIAALLADVAALKAALAEAENARDIAEMQVTVFSHHWATRVGECECCKIASDCPLCEADWNDDTQTMLTARCQQHVEEWAYDEARAALAQQPGGEAEAIPAGYVAIKQTDLDALEQRNVELAASIAFMREGKLPLAWLTCPGCPRLGDAEAALGATVTQPGGEVE